MMAQAFIHGIEDNPVAALAKELGLTLVPMDECKLSSIDGQPVPESMDKRIQGLWNRVLDDCAEQQKNSGRGTSPPPGMGSAGDDSRGETSEESHGEGSSSAESETAEHEDTSENHLKELGVDGTRNVARTGAVDGEGGASQESNAPLGKGKAGGPVGRAILRRPGKSTVSTTRSPASLGEVLDETAREHLAAFSKAELEVWNWHRGNLEISCGAVSDSRC